MERAFGVTTWAHLILAGSFGIHLGCGPSSGADTIALPLLARCTAHVEGLGPVAIEEDYLPHVVACENGAAPTEALAAQAIAARSYLYYTLEREGSITDGPGDQVYRCAQDPNEAHHQAVKTTERVVLQFGAQLVAGFYVAGATPSSADCVAEDTDEDPTSTERYVTYNQGRREAAVEQTSLGFIDPENTSNRGCMSQNGSTCLADQGRTFEDILRFYYGEDIALTRLPACDPTLEPAPISTDRSGCRCVAPLDRSSPGGWFLLAGAFFFLGWRRTHRRP